MGPKDRKEAFVTLATNDVYCKGARTLAQSLRLRNTTKDLVVMVTPQVSHTTRLGLDILFDKVIEVDVMDSNDEAHLALLKRPELGVTFTKIHCWTLTDYTKCVFMDADTMALTNVDNLFERDEFTAAPDAGWPDMFNSGVFVYKPSMETFNALVKLAESDGSFDGGDQGLLNTYFSDWLTGDITKHLSFLYNMHSTATYTYSPAFARFGQDTRIVHFIGTLKPWHHMYDRDTGMLYQAEGSGIHEEHFLRHWWSLYYMSEDELQKDPSTRKEIFHQWMWRTNQIDFEGTDKYDNIESQMDSNLETKPDQTSLPAQVPQPDTSQPDQVPSDETSQPAKVVQSETGSQPDAKEGESKSGDAFCLQSPAEAATVDKDSTLNSDLASDNPVSDTERFEKWKQGTVDFMGGDQFAQIQARIDGVIGNQTSSTTEQASVTEIPSVDIS